MELNVLRIVLLISAIPIANGAIPGQFFWKPRLGIDLALPTTEANEFIAERSKENVAKGLVVLIDTYSFGMSVMALAVAFTSAPTNPHLNPMTAYFYTTSYRWALRHLSMMPMWLGGKGGSYCDTHKHWRRRFFYMDEFIPKYLRYLFPYVKKEQWEQEEKELKLYKRYSESAFGKHYRYPSKDFNDFKSFESSKSNENEMSSSEGASG